MQFDYHFSDLCYIHRVSGAEISCEDLLLPHYKILLLCSGRAELSLEGPESLVQAGDIVLVGPGRNFRLCPGPGMECDYYLVYFTEHLIPSGLLPMYRYAEGIYPVGEGLISELFQRFDFHAGQCADEQQIKMLFRCVLTEILVYFSRQTIRFLVPGKLSRNIEAVVTYIEQNLDKPLSIEDICKHFHYSRSHLCAEFTEALGVPIMQYTRQRRMRYANALLRSGMTASETALQLGFTDYSSFYRQYCRVIGHSPYDDLFPQS